MQQGARKRGAWVQLDKPRHLISKSPRMTEEADNSRSGPYHGEKITVAIHPDLLECRVCCGPLKPPLFQCARGHVSCSECCTDGALVFECLLCHGLETATRCRAMERVLDGLSVPCAFRERGCAAMVPYAARQAHEAACHYLPCHCPIAGCDGYSGRSLRDHVAVGHPEVRRVAVRPGCLTAMSMRLGEQARVLCLGDGSDKEFMLVVGQGMSSGRALSMIHLMDEPVDDEVDFKYRIEVVGAAGVLSLSGQPERVDRLTKPYQANTFLFVPNAVWEADPQDVPVFVELK